jgi:hypothetical protein
MTANAKPKALESGDAALCAQLLAWQSDAYMGIAGGNLDDRVESLWAMSEAKDYADEAESCELSHPLGSFAHVLRM